MISRTWFYIQQYIIYDRSGKSALKKIGKVIKGLVKAITSKEFWKNLLKVAVCSILAGTLLNIGTPLSGQTGLSGGSGLRSLLPIGVGDTSGIVKEAASVSVGAGTTAAIYYEVTPTVVWWAQKEYAKHEYNKAASNYEQQQRAAWLAAGKQYFESMESRPVVNKVDQGDYIEHVDANDKVIFLEDKRRGAKIVYDAEGAPVYYITEGDGERWDIQGYGDVVPVYVQGDKGIYDIGTFRAQTVLTDKESPTTNQQLVGDEVVINPGKPLDPKDLDKRAVVMEYE